MRRLYLLTPAPRALSLVQLNNGVFSGTIQWSEGLRIIDAMAPCVVMVDEVEKALAGVASSGATDSGVTARLFGTFLTWLNDPSNN